MSVAKENKSFSLPIKKILSSYRAASFRKERYGAVTERIQSIRNKIRNCRSKSLLRDLVRQYDSLAYFDSPSGRLELTKYRSFLNSQYGSPVDKTLDLYVSEFEKMSLNKGVIQALKTFKSLYGLGCRYAASHCYEPLEYIKSDRNGFPYLMKPIQPFLHGERSDRQTALGILQVIKLVRFHPKTYSLGEIQKTPLCTTSAFTQGHVRVGSYFIEALNNKEVRGLPPKFKFRKFLRSYKLALKQMFPDKYQQERLDSITKSSCLHFSGRNGPNGPCLGTVVIDYDAVSCDKVLYEHIKAMAELTSNIEMQVVMDKFENENKDFHSEIGKIPIHSKINLKEESWGRLRPFATVDWFSHSSLRGFHKWLYSYLEKLPEDCTKNQDAGSDVVRLWTASSVMTESADLSEATNAIPLLVQREIVQQIAGDDFAYHWANIISNRTFKGPSGEAVIYSCGQPMGASSSWPMLAIWHHVIVRACLNYLNINWCKEPGNENYFIIGDDIVMKSKELFHIYEVAVKILQGVGISKAKGFHQETVLPGNPLPGESQSIAAEFAKRIFCNGREITPIPPDEVVSFVRSPSLFPNLLESLAKRDYLVGVEGLHDLAYLSFDGKLALDCALAPFRQCPYQKGYTANEMELLRSGTIWSLDPIYKDKIEALLLDKLRERSIKTLLDMGDRLTNWADACDSEERLKVKSWLYKSTAQSTVFYLTMEAMQSVYDRTLEEFYDTRPELTPENWYEFKRCLSELQVVFEIDNIFKDINKPKSDRIRFVNDLLANAIKAVRKEVSGLGNSKENLT